MRFIKAILLAVMLVAILLFAIFMVAMLQGNVAVPLGQTYEKATLNESDGTPVSAVIGVGFILSIITCLLPHINITDKGKRTPKFNSTLERLFNGGVAGRLSGVGKPSVGI